MTREDKSGRTQLHEQENILRGTKRTIVLLVLGVICFVANLDQNGISTILPTIANDLNAEKTIIWAGTSSLIANTIFTVQFGRLSDIFGRTICLLGTLAIFSLAELICGFAQNGPMLYVARGLTGMSGGALISLVTIVASDVIPLEKRGKYQGLVGGWAALGNIIGPFLSSGFATAGEWRGFFWFMVPMGIIAAVLGWWLLPKTKPTDGLMKNVMKIDYLGTVSSAACIVSFLIPISGAGSYYQWDDPWVIVLLVISVLSFVAFIFIEWKFARLPMIPLGMFRDKSVCALCAQTFLVAWASQVNNYFLPIYSQNLRGWSSLASAGISTCSIGGLGLVSVISGAYISKKKRYGGVIRLGNLILVASTGAMISFDADTSLGVIIPVLLINGVALGMTTQPTIVALQAHTKKEYRAVITSTRNFVRSFGAATGVAASSGIFQSSLKKRVPAEYKDQVSRNTYSIPAAYREVVSPYYEKASRDVFIAMTAIAVLNLLLGVLWKDEGLARKEEDIPMTETKKDPNRESTGSSMFSTSTKGEEASIDLKFPDAAWGVDVTNRLKQIV